MKNKYLTECKLSAEHCFIFQAAENQALWIENQQISAYQLNLFNLNAFYWITISWSWFEKKKIQISNISFNIMAYGSKHLPDLIQCGRG